MVPMTSKLRALLKICMAGAFRMPQRPDTGWTRGWYLGRTKLRTKKMPWDWVHTIDLSFGHTGGTRL